MFIFLKYNIYAYFFKIFTILSNTHHSQGFGRVYKHSQPNFPHPYPSSKFVVPTRSLFTSQYDSNNDCCVTVIVHKQPSPVSNLTTTTQVNNDRIHYYVTQSMISPRKNNHSTPELPETTNTTTLV